MELSSLLRQLSDNQNKTMADGIEKAIKNFKPKKRFNLYKIA